MAAGFSSQLQPTYIAKVILSYYQCIYLLSAFDLHVFCKKERRVAFHKQAHEESFNDCEMRGNENI